MSHRFAYFSYYSSQLLFYPQFQVILNRAPSIALYHTVFRYFFSARRCKGVVTLGTHRFSLRRGMHRKPRHSFLILRYFFFLSGDEFTTKSVPSSFEVKLALQCEVYLPIARTVLYSTGSSRGRVDSACPVLDRVGVLRNAPRLYRRFSC